MAFVAGRLGKLPPKIDPRTLQLGPYATRLPSEPETADWGSLATNIGPMGNLDYGDCVLAARGQARHTWTSSNHHQIIVPDEIIIDEYVRVGGFVRGNPATDNGANMLVALNDWRKIGCGGQTIDAYAEIKTRHVDFVKHGKQSIAFFGGCYMGVWLPQSAQRQDRWHVSLGGTDGDPAHSSWGGHCIWVYAYDAKGVWCITWGQRLFISWTFLRTYCDEAYVVASRDWADDNGAPTGAVITELVRDVREVAA